MKEYEYDPAKGNFYDGRENEYRYEHWVGGSPVEWPSAEPVVNPPAGQAAEQDAGQYTTQATEQLTGQYAAQVVDQYAGRCAAQAAEQYAGRCAAQAAEQNAAQAADQYTAQAAEQNAAQAADQYARQPAAQYAELYVEKPLARRMYGESYLLRQPTVQPAEPPIEEPYQSVQQGWQPGMGTERQHSLQAYRKNRESGTRFTALVLAACMVVGTVFGVFGAFAYDRYKTARGESGGSTVLYESVIRNVSTGEIPDGEMTVVETAAVVKQTVVEITVEISTRYGRTKEFAGSGVIISQDGYIVTNYHVIEDAQSITVCLPDGQKYTASIVGSDNEADLAVLKIPVSGLTSAVLGDSSTVQVGQTSLAVGNPLGELGGTVTSGIISALDREVLVEGGYYVMTLLQTDAAVSPGNSGGGLFNLYGELIGIVNAKSIGIDVDGIGFAIPINSARKVIDDIITMGYVRGRVSAGLEVYNVSSPREAMMYQVSQTGLYIANSKDSRLQAGDRIVGLNDDDVSDFADFKTALYKYKIGDTVNITVMRGYDRVTVDIILVEMKP